MFSRRGPDDVKSPDVDRDIFNEKPSKEDIISATEGQGKFLTSKLSFRIQRIILIIILCLRN